MSRERKEMEYPDAPSGFVMLYNYKSPFMPYTSGYGYEGVLMFDGDSDKIQCHLCGEWFDNLAHHLHREHATTASEYKETVGLLQTTALLNEKQRAVLIQKGTERFKNLKPAVHKSAETLRKIAATNKGNRTKREQQNLRGTCPAQLIDRLQKQYAEVGTSIPYREVKGIETMRKVFGSYKEACEQAGIPYNDRIKDYSSRTKYYRSDMVNWIRDHIVDGKVPTVVDYSKTLGSKRGAIYAAVKRLGGWKALCHEALISDGLYRKVSGYRYSKEELLKFLTDFKKHNNRNPSISDCKRGLLPYASRYIYHWKSWKNALKAAGL